MANQQLENVPTEVKEQLPEHGQQIFMAAFNAASDDGMNEQDATQVAWNSVKGSYEQDENGNWILAENSERDRPNIVGTEKDTSDPIGSRENNAGTMSAS